MPLSDRRYWRHALGRNVTGTGIRLEPEQKDIVLKSISASLDALERLGETVKSHCAASDEVVQTELLHQSRGACLMCGKFMAMASWAEVVDFAQALTDGKREPGNDQEIGYRVMNQLNIICWDAEVKKRRLIPMRWG